MKGRWYSSLFMHYAPITWDVSTQTAIQTFGERFREMAPPDPKVPELRMRGTGMREPQCEHEWCMLAREWPPRDGGNVAATPSGAEFVAPEQLSAVDEHDECAAWAARVTPRGPLPYLMPRSITDISRIQPTIVLTG